MSKFLLKKDLKKIVRLSASHKGMNGRVVAVGGSEDYVGAIALAGIAALRSGVDLVIICAPEKVAWAINRKSLDIITKKLPGKIIVPRHISEIKKMLRPDDVLLFGNGVGLNVKTKKAMQLLSEFPQMKVIDADALKSISTKNLSNSILTPHKKELEILLKNTSIEEIVKKNNIVLIKGKIDEIHSKNNIHYNKTGNSRMTVDGTGDILAGLCAGFLAQYKSLEEAAKTAAFVNGECGDNLLRKKGFTFTAEDMLEELPHIVKGLHVVKP
ncbi:MAG: NAD(P)H-hydrate dehydratase [Nanoarchaeota archaeon]|nr:MAG: NAD(P)H-hydrate dehydratase [Nanoarchaeota archaeon]